MIKRYNILSTISAALCAVLMAVSLPACDGVIYDDLDPCPHGVRLRFVYDHNMEFAYRLIKEPKRIKRQIHLVKFAYWLLIKKL